MEGGRRGGGERQEGRVEGERERERKGVRLLYCPSGVTENHQQQLEGEMRVVYRISYMNLSVYFFMLWQHVFH